MSPEVGVVKTPSQDAPKQQGAARAAPQQRANALPTPGLQHSLPPLPGVAAAVLARSPAGDDPPTLDVFIPDSVWPEELEGQSEATETETETDPYDGSQEDWSLDGLLQRALDRRLQRKAADTKVLCPRYDGYDKAKDVGKYNCAGLAWRTYDFRGDLAKERDAVAAGTSDKKPGNLKLWFWEYDLHLETDDGRRTTENHDFHMVGGIIDKAGNDPDDVYTKNGARPVFGPGTGPSHKPKARDRAMSNDPSNTPASTDDGAPLYKARSNFKEIVKCHPCPK